MAKVITFSRTFPAYHPKAGQPTYFVEKFWVSTGGVKDEFRVHFENHEDFKKSILWSYRTHGEKHHTIRAGHRFKAGDYFSPRVWSGKPYNSKQIIIAPDTLIEKVWDFEIINDGLFCAIYIDKKLMTSIETFNKIANNDGLSREDLDKWFKLPKSFDGQIICWNKNINY